MKRLALSLVVLAAAFAVPVAFADDPPPPTTTTPTTTTPTTTTTPAPAVVPSGVTLAGVSIGGLDPDTAAQAVLDSFSRPVTLRFQRTRIEATPSLFALTVPIDSAIARALTVAPGTTLALRATVNRTLIRSFVAKLAGRFNRKPVDSRLLFRSVKPVVTQSADGRTIDQRTAVAAIADQLVHGTRAGLKLTAKFIKPKATEKTIGPVVVIQRSSNTLTLYNGAKVVR